MRFSNNVGFTIGTGRCGTLFLYQLVAMEPGVASSHERNPDNEAFHRYCKWNRLSVDNEGFLATKEREIITDLESNAYSFEASPYVSLSVKELYERFGAKFILLVRRPDRVVTSFAFKGFYRKPYHFKESNLAIGYQDQSPEKVHTFFARIAPRGEFLDTWNKMTQIGKVAWFWNAFNRRSLDLLHDLPQESYRIVRIEDFDYERYCELADFLGYKTQINQTDFDSLSSSKPHAFWRKRNIDQWSDLEVSEFESQVEELAIELGYEFRISELRDEAIAEREQAMQLGHIPEKKKGPQFWRLRRSTAGLLHRLAGGVEKLAGGVDVE